MILYLNEIPTNGLKNKLLQVNELNYSHNKNPIEIYLCLAAPDVVTKTTNEDWEFVLLACDGIWDVLSNEEVLKFVRTRIAQQMPPEMVEKKENIDEIFFKDFIVFQICEELMTRCLAPNCQMGGLGCDNMTVVLCLLLHNQPYSTLAAKCSKNYSNGDISTDSTSK